MRKATSLLLAALLISLSILNLLSFPTAAGPLTTVTIETEPLTEIEVAPGSLGQGAVQGNVTCVTLDPAPVIVNLNADTTIGTSTLDHPQMEFQGVGTDTQEFKIVIQVPILITSSGEHTCTVSGTWQQGATSDSAEGDMFQVIILPFSYCNITCNSPEKEITQGESVSFKLLLNNAGNIDEIYNVNIANRDELEEKGITIDTIDEIAVVEQGFEKLEMDVHTSSDTPSRVYHIAVVITSEVTEEPVEFEFLLFLRVEDKIAGVDVLSNPLVLIIIAVVIIVSIVVYIKKR